MAGRRGPDGRSCTACEARRGKRRSGEGCAGRARGTEVGAGQGIDGSGGGEDLLAQVGSCARRRTGRRSVVRG